MRSILISILILSSLPIFSQDVLTEQKFLELVLNFHPIAKQASLEDLKMNTYLKKAKGNFDPKLYLSYQDKQFDEKNYYQFLDNTLKIPTWIGADVKINYSWNRGQYINAENTLPSNGLISAGIEVNVLEGLIYDQRRFEKQQAKNYAQIGNYQKQQMLNQLFFNALENYWEWYEMYQNYQIKKEGQLLSLENYKMVVKSFQLGDKSAMDTLEASTQLQLRNIDLMDAELTFKQASYALSSYLWFENETPAQLSASVVPGKFDLQLDISNNYIQKVKDSLNIVQEFNPKIKIYEYKYLNTTLNTKLKKELIKPTLVLGYNFLNQAYEEDYFNQLNIQNYKWSIKFEMPLFLRKERADFKIAQFEMEQSNLDLQQQIVVQQNKIKLLLAKIESYIAQHRATTNLIHQTRKLVDAEKRLFSFGESSLFLVNYREQSFLKLLEKRAALEKKINASKAELVYESGIAEN